MLKVENLIGLPVIVMDEGREIGIVRDVVIEPVKMEVSGLVVEEKIWYRGAKFIAFKDISSIGDYAITIENSQGISDLNSNPEIIALLDKGVKIKGTKVITRGGKLLGTMVEFYINGQNGKIERYEFIENTGDEKGDRVSISAEDIFTLGKDVVIIKEEVAKTKQQSFPKDNHLDALANSSPKKVTGGIITAGVLFLISVITFFSQYPKFKDTNNQATFQQITEYSNIDSYIYEVKKTNLILDEIKKLNLNNQGDKKISGEYIFDNMFKNENDLCNKNNREIRRQKYPIPTHRGTRSFLRNDMSFGRMPERICSLPVSGKIESHFGIRFHPVHRVFKFHKGIDIKTNFGAEIYSAGDGVVKFVGWKSGYGKLIIIEHANNISTYYGHASGAVVKVGDVVSKGQLIGYVGNTGNATGVHLHYEIRKNGIPCDPLKFDLEKEIESNVVLSKDTSS